MQQRYQIKYRQKKAKQLEKLYFSVTTKK